MITFEIRVLAELHGLKIEGFSIHLLQFFFPATFILFIGIVTKYITKTCLHYTFRTYTYNTNICCNFYRDFSQTKMANETLQYLLEAY